MVTKTLSDINSRILNLKEQILLAKPEVCSTRAVSVTKSYQETEGLPMIIRRALALQRILRKLPVYILEGELIVGHPASKLRSAEVFPEYGIGWVEAELDDFEVRDQDRYVVPPKVKEDLRTIVFPYWRSKGIEDICFSSMPEEMKWTRTESKVYALTAHESTGLGHVILDHKGFIKEGLRKKQDECKEKLNKLDISEPGAIEKQWFLKAVIITIDAAIEFARRYSEEAKKLAEDVTDTKRKEELLKIAEVCSRVPEYPARNFHEALQASWFLELIVQIETNASSVSVGRLDQILYPYYQKDIDNELISKEEAQELLEAYWIKFSEPIILYNNDTVRFWSGYPQGQCIMVGGQTPEGKDATNEVTYMCLKAQAHIGLGQPNSGARIHRDSPFEYIYEVAKIIREGSGMPMIHNDEVYVPSLMARGLSLKQALDYGVHGCTEGSIPGVWGRTNGGTFNLVKCLEYALTNGHCLLTGEKLGLETGNPEEFKSLDDVISAFAKQVQYFVKHLCAENNLIDQIQSEYVPIPFVSVAIPGCLENAKDASSGGAFYNWTGGPSAVGTATVADSLFAIKKYVFEDKVLTMRELVEILKSDFEAKESLRQVLKNKVPKYGNDYPEVDEMVSVVMSIFSDEVEKHRNTRGGNFYSTFIPVSSYVHLGKDVAATPDGRHAKTPLSDGISPDTGRDLNGPTAAIKSICRGTYPESLRTVGIQINMKMHPSTLKTESDLAKFANLIKTYCDLGGMHIQLNVVSADTLRAAQKNPEKYRGLTVRVAGYSALFTELSKDLQNSIIERTEHKF